MVYIVTGLPLSGKTTVSEIIKHQTGALLLNTDDIRKDLYPDDRLMPDGDFTSEQIDGIYNIIPKIVKTIAGGNSCENIVVDGTFRAEEQRRAVKMAAEQAGHQVLVLYVSADENCISERSLKRVKQG